MKSKHLVCLSFLWWQVFWGNERKHFTHIPGLPWLKINEKVVKKKKRTTVENLRKDCHIEFHMYLNYVRSLSFDEKPDYDYLRKLFNKLYYKIQNMTGNLTGLQKKVTSILLPYPCSHFYFDIKFGDRLYSKEKRRAWPVLLSVGQGLLTLLKCLLLYLCRCKYYKSVFFPKLSDE